MSFSNLTSTTTSSRPKDKSLQNQLSTLTSELELSTFLNKGILQSNSEYKIRIAELERENTILRAAEARLAEMEEMLDGAEKRLGEVEDELERERKRGEVLGKEMGEERDYWRGKWEEVRGRWEMVKRGMEEVCKDSEGGVTQGEGSRRKPVARGAQTTGTSRQRLHTPSPKPEYTPATKGIAIKRKRVPVSPDEDSPEPPEYISRSKLKVSSNTDLTTSRRKLPQQPSTVTHASKQARPIRAVNRIGVVEVTPIRKVKVEQISPGDVEESDDDPLAMS